MNKIISVLVAVLVLVIGFSIFYTPKPLGTADVPFYTVTSGSALSSITVPVKVVSANTGRSYLIISNDSATTTYLGLSATSTGVVPGTGIRLNSGDSYEIRDINLYQGDIWMATTSVANQKLIYVER